MEIPVSSRWRHKHKRFEEQRAIGRNQNANPIVPVEERGEIFPDLLAHTSKVEDRKTNPTVSNIPPSSHAFS
jgi:hypothetical protein